MLSNRKSLKAKHISELYNYSFHNCLHNELKGWKGKNSI